MSFVLVQVNPQWGLFNLSFSLDIKRLVDSYLVGINYALHNEMFSVRCFVLARNASTALDPQSADLEQYCIWDLVIRLYSPSE
jgi:hypothetical protein